MNRRTPELDAVLERIHKKLIAKHVLLGEPATLQKLRAFESSYRVSLPSEFRHFLLKIGSSCQWRPGSAPFVAPLLDCQTPEKLALPFPFENEWIWEFEEEPSHDIQEVENGTFPLADIGCGIGFHLIVTGPCKGEVWHFSEMGIQPCCPRQSFLGWLEKWLDSDGDVDYFEEYPYD
ncbi:SMI1/KNR4 family protein [Clostridiaceae bacterium]|nr:SMI1/KNR4 family protein [Clostridiaceae bacterium]